MNLRATVHNTREFAQQGIRFRFAGQGISWVGSFTLNKGPLFGVQCLEEQKRKPPMKATSGGGLRFAVPVKESCRGVKPIVRRGCHSDRVPQSVRRPCSPVCRQ